MIGQSASFLRLRWLAVRLLSLLWATMDSAAAVAERSDFGRSLIAAKNVEPRLTRAKCPVILGRCGGGCRRR
jgi:hypothetical protein